MARKESIKYLNERDKASFWEKKYKKLYAEFEQYKRESVKWSVADFTDMEAEGWSITKEQAQEALEDMISNHDAEYGIGWTNVEDYLQRYGTEVKKGEELWRKNKQR